MRRRPRFAVVGAGLVVLGGLLAMARDEPDAIVVRSAAPTAPASPPSCGAPTELVQLTGRAETLRAGWLPAGFTLANGREESPWGPWSPRYGASGGREIALSRTFSGGPAVDQIDPGPGGREATTTVDGQAAAVVEAGGRVLIAWKEKSDVTDVVNGSAVSRELVQRVANAVVYERAEPASGAGWSPCRPSLPAGARSRTEILAAAHGTRPEAKLVRLSAVEQAHPGLLRCNDTPCDPGMIGWAVLTHDLPPRAGAPMSPPPTGPGWSLTVHDAATGAVRSGLSGGPGREPAYWGSLEDLAS